jgi:squalene-hopene/tetraprenyl-beta-curcumene cyclase
VRIAPLRPARVVWDVAKFPEQVPEMRAQVRDRVQARIDRDGAIREPCHSRVLESALGLRALRRVGGHPLAEQRLVRYLDAHCQDADPVDRLLARAALGHSIVPDGAGLDRLLDRAPGFTSARKRATLTAILYALGVTSDPGDYSFTIDPMQDGLHSWARAQTAAVKVILAVAAGRPGQITAADLALLDSTQADPDVWECNLLVHLSTVHALSLVRVPGQVVAAGVRKALRYQRADGGLPFVTDVDTWCTATGGLALASAGAPPAVLHRLARYLVARQHSDGGWAFSDRVALADTDDVSVALEFLDRLDPVRYRGAISRGFAWLGETQQADGGFPTYRGAPSEPCMTIAAINALTSRRRSRGAMLRALRYLNARPDGPGTFPPDWSASRFHTLFRAALAGTHPAAASLPSARRMAARAVAVVRESQNSDGGWGQQPGEPSDPISSAYALIALTRQDDPVPAVRGLEYLLAAHESGLAPVPDSIGPRPFVFAVPALADIFSLLALGHVAAACGVPADVVGRRPEPAVVSAGASASA